MEKKQKLREVGSEGYDTATSMPQLEAKEVFVRKTKTELTTIPQELLRIDSWNPDYSSLTQPELRKDISLSPIAQLQLVHTLTYNPASKKWQPLIIKGQMHAYQVIIPVAGVVQIAPQRTNRVEIIIQPDTEVFIAENRTDASTGYRLQANTTLNLGTYDGAIFASGAVGTRIYVLEVY